MLYFFCKSALKWGFRKTSLNAKEVFRKPTSPPLPLREGPPLSPSPFFSWRRLAALGNMKANFHCAHLHNLSPQGTGDVPTALSIVFTTPSVPLVGDRNLRGKEETALLGAQTASLYGWRTIRGLRQQRSCSFLCGMNRKDTRCWMLARC